MRRLVTLLAGVLLALAVLWLSSPAEGQVTGGCSATLNGNDADAARTVRSAIELDEDQSAELAGTAPGPIDTYEVYLTFGPTRFPATEGTVENGETSYRTDFEVSDYATYGVGLYRVEAETTGTECSSWGYVKITGRNPLTTVAGAAAAAITVLGLAGMSVAFVRAGRAGA